MKKIPRITINRIELCKQPKSGAFRTAILTPFHRMSSVFGFDSPAAKNIQQIVYKIYGSHYEDLNTRHYLCCQTHLSQLFVMSGGASSSWKGGDRDFLNCKKVMRLLFSFSLSLPLLPSLPSFLLSLPFLPFLFFNISKTTRYVFATQVYKSPQKTARDSCFMLHFYLSIEERGDLGKGGVGTHWVE